MIEADHFQNCPTARSTYTMHIPLIFAPPGTHLRAAVMQTDEIS